MNAKRRIFFYPVLFILIVFAQCAGAAKALAKSAFVFSDIILRNDTTATRKPAATERTYLALGDSYTIGQSIDSMGRFPAQAAAIIAHHGYAIPRVDYIATTGWKTVNLQWAIEAQRTRKTYDVVSLLIGVNDQYLLKDTIGYRAHFTNLIQKAIAFAGGNSSHVFVLSIPDYGVTPFGNSLKNVTNGIDEFNCINKQIARLFGASYIDVTGISRYDAIDSTMLAPDDLHPSAKQYAQWAQVLARKMLTVLE